MTSTDPTQTAPTITGPEAADEDGTAKGDSYDEQFRKIIGGLEPGAVALKLTCPCCEARIELGAGEDPGMVAMWYSQPRKAEARTHLSLPGRTGVQPHSR